MIVPASHFNMFSAYRGVPRLILPRPCHPLSLCHDGVCPGTPAALPGSSWAEHPPFMALVSE